MSKKLAYERYHWFHGQIQTHHYPNASMLADKFEISVKQAQRDIEFMRNRLRAPLTFDYCKRGYYYENHSYQLPPIWLQEDELIAFCLAYRLAASIPDKNLKASLNHLLEKFLAVRFLGTPPKLQDIHEKVSIKNIEYYKVKEEIFHRIIAALFNNDPLNISYYTPHKNEITRRTIMPLHLLCYMGSWHIISYCTLRYSLRDFALSRIRTIESATEKIIIPNSLPPIKDFIRKNFGLMSGNESIEICLRFTPEVSRWIMEQVWHAGQNISINPDGTLCLTFPACDFREVQHEILKFGSSVEVIAPVELRNLIQAEIKKMSLIYR